MKHLLALTVFLGVAQAHAVINCLAKTETAGKTEEFKIDLLKDRKDPKIANNYRIEKNEFIFEVIADNGKANKISLEIIDTKKHNRTFVHRDDSTTGKEDLSANLVSDDSGKENMRIAKLNCSSN